ncbi:LOW QUALITY PROTEIN: caspase-1 [Procambarus clarkii]|uniref:LOW QUALITY PROTEIN: caspase-1 n=1 Tax=Procambarus clarkii TaxID=6728 RepID=UPI0037433CB8
MASALGSEKEMREDDGSPSSPSGMSQYMDMTRTSEFTQEPHPTSMNLTTDNPDTSDTRVPDTSDAKKQGYGIPVDRPSANMPVGALSLEYNMNHKQRGLAVIFVHKTYCDGGPSSRACADHDRDICKKAFKHLGFTVEIHEDLRKKKFLQTLEEVSQRDHSDYDGLVVVFMSHGGIHQNTNQEFIWTFDGKVNTTELWKNFHAANCPSLAGKPKMFFIQACRGEDADKGVQLKARPRGLAVKTDSPHITQQDKEYAIPLYADMLMMWASYTGMYAFKSAKNGINGSVYLHFLTKVLTEDAHNDDLATMLLRVTREVAVQYESRTSDPKDKIHKNKQVPQTLSTLMRKLYFFKK